MRTAKEQVREGRVDGSNVLAVGDIRMALSALAGVLAAEGDSCGKELLTTKGHKG
ncbi:hypothetical protein BCR44DRAFT_1439839 [Catenaria anguillulae PL171]|uniref:Uncharacterized protein n=1 Tax=Catenaria anguillulae PL171 TaxID=765915 RepID=A0A1Y2HDA6_9FUNG|nr:hypothetical protein BCR44DRAFT_1439839 [Catenaria anguillulae PL171]